VTDSRSTKSGRPWRISFFTIMAGILLLLVVAGFVPTLYARPLFDVPSIPLYLYLHGIVLSGWFAWFLAQSLLISAGAVANHRRIGMWGAVFGVLVVAAALMATLGGVSRATSRGFDLDADASVFGIGVSGVTVNAFLSGVVWANFGSALCFAILLTVAVVLRRRPESHKRLMLLASISIIGPALARIARWSVFGGEQGPFIPVVFWSLLLLVAGHDLWSRKRLHATTASGILFIGIVDQGAGVVGRSDIGQTLVRALG
jgi:uncharacterized membrane protein YozB (DUF420 family)